MICLEAHEFLGAIGYYYFDFRQTSDEEVIEAIARYSSDAKVGQATQGRGRANGRVVVERLRGGNRHEQRHG